MRCYNDHDTTMKEKYDNSDMDSVYVSALRGKGSLAKCQIQCYSKK